MWNVNDSAQNGSIATSNDDEISQFTAHIDMGFSWLKSLPIAAAVFDAGGGAVRRVGSNGKFDALNTEHPGEKGLGIKDFIGRIERMAAGGSDRYIEQWTCSNLVNQCRMDVNIGRFGDSSQNLFLVSLLDHTAEMMGHVNLRREMIRDNLTGFYNRAGFDEQVEHAIIQMARNADHAGRYGIILIDLLRFSRINESAGSLVGDELIATIARRLNSNIRGNEIIARLASNEFAIFVNMASGRENIAKIADRLISVFDEPFHLSSLEVKMECAAAAAIGVARNDDPVDTLRNAQIALKRAKQTKNFEQYSYGSVDQAKHRLSIETDLRHALERGELNLYYQPLVDLDTGQLNGFEALARWNHPILGPISPLEFIPVAEESGLIVRLGRWALEKAAHTIAEWDRMSGGKLPFTISVNMSAVQLLRDDVAQTVANVIAGAGIKGERLTLELTESAFVSDPSSAKRVLNELKALDVNLAMDDFGTGYSNLGYLQQLPIDVLKIDRSFISEMMVDSDKRAIVSTVLSLARALDMKTTAEGIESVEVFEALKNLGCSFGQGFYYAEPLNAVDAYAFLVESNAAVTA